MKAKREKLLSFATSECKKEECKNHHVSVLFHYGRKHRLIVRQFSCRFNAGQTSLFH